MLLRKADVGPGFKASKPSDDEFDFYCEALDASDLVLTGEAESLDFEKENEARYLSAGSGSEVYETKAQSAESWRRGTSVAGMKCMEAGFRKLAKEIGRGTTFASLRKVAFPRIAPDTAAFRVVFKVVTTPMIMDSVVMRNGRAQAWTLVFGVPSAYPSAEQERLSRIVAERMAKAMRGE